MPALELQSVSKDFKSKRQKVSALKKISFEVKEGEVFGFVGPNGAGKTTTIKIILNLIKEYDGQAKIYGKDVQLAESRNDIAYVPENPALYEQFSPLEILSMGLSMHGRHRHDKKQWSMAWLERFSIAHVANRRIRDLSKGTAQRVALAHAMAVESRLLILDEPLSGLDPVGRKDVVDILSEYKQNGGAIFFTSHVLHDVERIADRFGFIHQGELITTRSPRDLITERSDRFIVRYQAEKAIENVCQQVRQNEFETEVAQAELPAFLGRIHSSNGHLVTVKPAVSLETVFFKILEDKQKEKATQTLAN